MMKKLLLLLLLLLGLGIAWLAMNPEQATQMGVEAERKRSGLVHKKRKIAGETWHYLEGGPKDAEVVLLLHGFAAEKDHWTRFAAGLTDTYRVIAPDLPGFGESARHADWDYSLKPQRERLARFVEALNIESFHLAGNSMGGHLTGLYTHKYPEQVLTMGLFNNAGIKEPKLSEMGQAVARGENPLVISNVDDFDRLLAFVSHKKPFIPWPVKGVMAQRAVDNAEFNQFIFESYRSDRYSGLEDLLGQIRQPTLVLWGEYDRVLDVSIVDAMRPLLPQAEVVIMEDTGHIPMLERPAETAEYYRAFIDKH